MQLIIRLATSTELDNIAEIIRQTSKWLKSKGILQWSENFSASRLEDEIRHSELFVALDQSQKIIGTLSLSIRKSEFWPDDILINGLPSIYLHRVAISRECAGRGLGSKIIEWSKDYSLGRDVGLLRLECDKSNPFLSDFYRSSGFNCVGESFYSPWKMTFRLFEMKLK